MGNLDWIEAHTEANLNREPLPNDIPVDFPEATTNHYTGAKGAALYRAVLLGNKREIDKWANVNLEWLGKFRRDGLFLKEGLSISYFTKELNGLCQTAIAADILIKKYPDVSLYKELWRHIFGALNFALSLFLDLRLNNGWVITVGPRWKHPPWEYNISGADILTAFYLVINNLEGLPNITSFHGKVLANPNHNYWENRPGDRLLKRMLSENVNVFSNLNPPTVPRGRLNYTIEWKRYEDRLHIRASNGLPKAADEGGIYNLMFEIRIAYDGIPRNYIWDRGVKKYSGIMLSKSPPDYQRLGPNSDMFPLAELLEIEETKEPDNIPPIEPPLEIIRRREIVLTVNSTINRLQDELNELKRFVNNV